MRAAEVRITLESSASRILGRVSSAMGVLWSSAFMPQAYRFRVAVSQPHDEETRERSHDIARNRGDAGTKAAVSGAVHREQLTLLPGLPIMPPFPPAGGAPDFQ